MKRVIVLSVAMLLSGAQAQAASTLVGTLAAKVGGVPALAAGSVVLAATHKAAYDKGHAAGVAQVQAAVQQANAAGRSKGLEEAKAIAALSVEGLVVGQGYDFAVKAKKQRDAHGAKAGALRPSDSLENLALALAREGYASVNGQDTLELISDAAKKAALAPTKHVSLLAAVSAKQAQAIKILMDEPETVTAILNPEQIIAKIS